MENEKNNQLAFLDVLVTRNNNRIMTSVYRKPTHTGQYLHYDSNHSATTKKGIVKTLYQRAKTICNNEAALQKEIANINTDLISNGYNLKTIQNSIRDSHTVQNKNVDQTDEKQLCIPYVRGVSEKIRRISKTYNIRTSFKSSRTLREVLTKTKPQHPTNTKNCIYEVPCECGEVYIGETKRPLHVRIEEHKKNTQRGETTKSGIANHVWDNQHHIQWSEAKVLAKEDHWYKRKFKEAVFIDKKRAFSQQSVEIPNVWRPLLGANNPCARDSRANDLRASSPTRQSAGI